MATILAFNVVHYDGLGDVYHFEDIIHALLDNERFKHVEVLAFICFDTRGTKKTSDAFSKN
jgi:hypothetical protein